MTKSGLVPDVVESKKKQSNGAISVSVVERCSKDRRLEDTRVCDEIVRGQCPNF